VRIDDFRGWGSPLTERGDSSLYGPHPWHMAGRNLTVWFRAPVEEIARHVPEPLTVPADGLCRVRFYELSHNAGLHDTLAAEEPGRGRFHEAVLAVPVAYKGEIGDYSVHLYSEDLDYICWARETVGWPVKDGAISISHPWPGQPLEAGTTVQAILERHGRRLITVTLTLTEPLPQELYPTKPGPTYTVKVIPSAEEGKFALRQLVVVRPQLPKMAHIWRAEATLSLGEGPADELHHFRSAEIVRADYIPSLDLTMPYGTVLENL